MVKIKLNTGLYSLILDGGFLLAEYLNPFTPPASIPHVSVLCYCKSKAELTQNQLTDGRFFVHLVPEKKVKVESIICNLVTVWSVGSVTDVLWSHLVDEEWATNEQKKKKPQESSRSLCCISNHPAFNTKSRYNIYIHGLKGKNRYICEGDGVIRAGPSRHISYYVSRVCLLYVSWHDNH